MLFVCFVVKFLLIGDRCRFDVMAAYKREIEAAPDPAARLQEIEAMLNELRTAEAFGVEEIIDPRDTRPLLCDWVTMAYEILPQNIGLKCRGFRP